MKQWALMLCVVISGVLGSPEVMAQMGDRDETSFPNPVGDRLMSTLQPTVGLSSALLLTSICVLGGLIFCPFSMGPIEGALSARSLRPLYLYSVRNRRALQASLALGGGASFADLAQLFGIQSSQRAAFYKLLRANRRQLMGHLRHKEVKLEHVREFARCLLTQMWYDDLQLRQPGRSIARQAPTTPPKSSTR